MLRKVIQSEFAMLLIVILTVQIEMPKVKYLQNRVGLE